MERKLAAILAADVVGYSRLMEVDEAGTLSALQAHREDLIDPTIAEHRGRIVKLMGDGTLVEFASVVDAVACAVAIQLGLAKRNLRVAEDRRIVLRIGVHLGDVMVEGEDLYGDGVNVAARLEGLADAGGICLSQQALDQVETKLDLAYEDLGEQQVKNIARPVHVFKVLPEGAEAKAPKKQIPTIWKVVAAAAAVLILATAGAWLFIDTKAPPPMLTAEGTPTDDPVLAMTTGPSIAVLPFDNMSGDPEQEIFADGLTEDIITALSKFPELFVIARNSTFQYKGRSVDVREVGRDLGVQYVLEGGLRKTGDKIRVSAQLLDSSNGAHLWAETYDRSLTTADIFAIQDEIREHVVATLADLHGIIPRTGLVAANRKNPESLSAYECYLRAWIVYDKVFTPDEHLIVRDCLERAVEADPEYADAWATLAWIYTDEDSWGYNPRANSLDRALEAAERAIELDPASQLAHWMLARTRWYRHELDAFFVGAERALAMNPNNSTILALAGLYSAYAGQWDRGVAMVRKAATLNPYHPGWYYFAFFHDYYRKGEYAAALAEAQGLNMPGFYHSQIVLAAANGQLGNKTEAQRAVEKLLELYPGFTIETGRTEYRKLNFAPEYIEQLMDGLRKAGIEDPDGSEARDGMQQN